MPRIRDLECTINNAHGPLQEYPDPTADDDASPAPSKTVYIPAVANEHFSIHITVHSGAGIFPAADRLQALFYFDGKREGSGNTLPVPRMTFTRKWSWTGLVDTNSAGRWRQRKYLFGKVAMTEDENAPGLLPAEKVALLGEIKVVVRRFVETGPPVPSKRRRIAWDDDADAVVHEKAAKGRALSTKVRLGRGHRASTPKYVTGIDLDTNDRPFAVFRFLYRSKRALESLGLLNPPRTPSPIRDVSRGDRGVPVKDEEREPRSRSRSPGQLSREELEAEVRRLRKANTVVKRERAESPVAGPSSAKRHRSKRVVETIDLTGV